MSPIDYNRYPKTWKSEIVPFILKRANNKCECCGLRNGQTVYSIKLRIKEGNRYKLRSIWFQNENDAIRESPNNNYKKVKVILTVAHLDHDEENKNVKYDRLRAWCQVCHLRYDAREKYLRTFKNKDFKK